MSCHRDLRSAYFDDAHSASSCVPGRGLGSRVLARRAAGHHRNDVDGEGGHGQSDDGNVDEDGDAATDDEITPVGMVLR